LYIDLARPGRVGITLDLFNVTGSVAKVQWLGPLEGLD
jgi:hypothetical protein